MLEYGTQEYESFRKENGVECIDGTRAIVVVDVQQVGSSCGFSMPKFDFVEYRTTLNEFFEKRVRNEEKGDRANGIEKYVISSFHAPFTSWSYLGERSV